MCVSMLEQSMNNISVKAGLDAVTHFIGCNTTHVITNYLTVYSSSAAEDWEYS